MFSIMLKSLFLTILLLYCFIKAYFNILIKLGNKALWTWQKSLSKTNSVAEHCWMIWFRQPFNIWSLCIYHKLPRCKGTVKSSRWQWTSYNHCRIIALIRFIWHRGTFKPCVRGYYDCNKLGPFGQPQFSPTPIEIN